MAENEVSLPVNIDTSEAVKSLDRFEREADKSFKSVEKSITSLGSAFKTFALAAVSLQTIKKAISEAIEAEDGLRRLNLALAGTGEYSEAASKAMTDFADSLSEVTGIDDDVIKSQLTVAKSFGITNEQAQELVKAATNLSAVTGQDLESAVKQLGGTLDGSVGKLGLLGSEFRNLTEEQAKNLGVIDLVNKKYGEAGEALGGTFAGSLSKVANAFNDMFKDIGKEIIENDGIKAIVSMTVEVLKTVTPVFSAIAKGVLYVFNLIVEGFGYIATAEGMLWETVGRALGLESLTETSIKLQNTFSKMSEKLYESSVNFEKVNNSGFDKTLLKVNDAAIKTKGSLKGLGKEAIALAEEGKKFTNSILAGFGKQAETEAQKAAQAIKSVEEQLKKGTISQSTAMELKLRIAEDFNAKIEKANEDSVKKQADDAAKAAADARARIEKAASQPIKFAIDEKGALSSKEIGASSVGGLSMALRGKSGAVDAVSQAFAGIGDMILPGIGGAVGGLAQLLAQGPEATKKFIKEFINSIPDIIQAISESIPVVVEALVDTMINRGGAARIGLAIAKAMMLQPLWASLGQQVFGKSGDEMAKSISSGLSEARETTKELISGFIVDFPTAVSKAFEGIGRALSDFTETFPEKLSAAFNEFFAGLSNAFGTWVSSLGSALYNFISDFPMALIQGVAGAVSSIFSGLSPLINALETLRRAVESAGSIAGKGGGKGWIAEAAGRVGSALGFAKGGVVPLYAADGAFVSRGTDTVPAMLTPGELVVPRDMVSELGSFLSTQQSPNGSGTTLDAIMNALQAPIVVKAEAKVNQSAFADIILQLNRQNMRLA